MRWRLAPDNVELTLRTNCAVPTNMTKPCQGPDANPRQPKTPAPSGAIDAHAHVFGPLDQFPYVEERGYTPPEASLDQWFAMHKALGIERGVLIQPSVHGTDNRAMLAAMAKAGGRLRGVVALDADVSDAELAALNTAGVRATRFNLQFSGGVALDAMASLADRVADLGWHVQFLMDARDLVDLGPKLMALPTDIVIDHVGFLPASSGVDHPGFQIFIEMVRSGKCWAKLSGPYRGSEQDPPYNDMTPYAQALIAARSDRIIWGTDWPHPALDGQMPNDGDLFDMLAVWEPNEARRYAILVNNPERLFGFDPV